MENLKIKDILKACNGKLIFGDIEKEIEGFSIDSRTIKNGDIFVGIKGEALDGNVYYKQAIENGAIGCILDEEFENKTGYKQFEYVKGELRHIFAAAEVVVSRAGANSICELVALKKPNVLIPLPLSASRGDQLLNAASFEKQGFSFVVKEEDADEPFNAETVIKAVDSVYSNREKYIEAMEKSNAYDAVSTIFSMINDIASGNA